MSTQSVRTKVIKFLGEFVMKNQREKFNDEILKNEKPITADELLAEIKPLLDDYFIGEITLYDHGITYSLPDGQKFILTAKEIVSSISFSSR